MDNFDKAYDLAMKFCFQKGKYLDAERQLLSFAECYEKLNAEEANLLRSEFKAQDRLGWLRISTTTFLRLYPAADILQKENLCRIFFAFYSFDNLDFGYDSINDVISVSNEMKKDIDLSKKIWSIFREITSSEIATLNLEKKIFKQ
jgi:hypothetical protein